MVKQLSILCIPGVAHGDADPALKPSWTTAIAANIKRWNPQALVDCDFMDYADLFDHAPHNPLVYGGAFAKLLASRPVRDTGDLSPGRRDIFAIPEAIRWSAAIIAQWVSEDELRGALRRRLLDQLGAKSYDAIAAHGTGSLFCYDALRRTPAAARNKYFISLGSQIGHPFIRNFFAGRIEPVGARMWYNLYNSQDNVFTAALKMRADNFAQLATEFDKPNDLLDHDPLCYFNHANAQARVWFELAGTPAARPLRRALPAARAATAASSRRALLVGINDYPNPAYRLEGCVNDTFLMSSALQESGYRPEDIRVLLNERATAKNILERLHWLLGDVGPGDERLFFYSGHGAQIPAYGAKEEVDHFNECLVPHDFDWSLERALSDDQFVELYSQLPYGSRFAAIFDCCHAGGMTRDGGLRARGIDPPNDIRHRALRWDADLAMWREREILPLNPSLAHSKAGAEFLGASGATRKLGRGAVLRGLSNQRYDRDRKVLGHYGAYLPIIVEACQEHDFSYEYRDGANSYGAFTFSLVKVLREIRGRGTNPTFATLAKLTAGRLKALGYQQTPSLIGPALRLRQTIPWINKQPRQKRRR